MAEKEVRLEIGDITVGAVIFDETPPTLDIRRTPTGINLLIPAAVELRWKDRKQPCPILMNLRAVITAESSPGDIVEVGRVWDDSVYFGTTSTERFTDKAELIWMNVLPSLVFIEESRKGRPPKFHFQVRGELFYILKVVAATPPDVIRMQPLAYEVLSFPHKFYGTTDIIYPNDVWERMIQAAF